MYHIAVKTTKSMGNGVFATKGFSKDELIELCPVIPIPPKFVKLNQPNAVLNFLEYWFYEWGPAKKDDAMVLGYGMIYNHSETPNANYVLNLNSKTVTIVANTIIKTGTEILIDYRLKKGQKLEILDSKTHEEIFLKS